MRWLLCALVIIAACGDSSPSNPSGGSSGLPNQNNSSSGTASSGSSGKPKTDGGTTGDDDDDDVPGKDSGTPLGPANVRIMAANTSTVGQSYDGGEGTRIFQGLKPDIVLIQEFNVGNNSETTIKDYVSTTFGGSFNYYRESGFGIPNGVISKYPITESGHLDSGAPDRGFAWAKITVPGAHPLYAFSVHLRTTSSSVRNTEAKALVAEIKKMAAPEDYIVVGGDLNTDSRGETCLTTLAEVVDTMSPHPADGNGNENTNANRGKPYDWVMASPNFVTMQVPTVIGKSSFMNGLVFDSRVYTPIEEVAPVQTNDSGAQDMQHMAVVKDFHLE